MPSAPAKKVRAKLPQPLVLNTNLKPETNVQPEKSKLKNFFGMRSLISPRSPTKAFGFFAPPSSPKKETFPSKFTSTKSAPIPESPTTQFDDDLSIDNSSDSLDMTPKRSKNKVGKEDTDIPQDTPPKAMKMLGLDENSRSTSKAERVLGAQHIHVPDDDDSYMLKKRDRRSGSWHRKLTPSRRQLQAMREEYKEAMRSQSTEPPVEAIQAAAEIRRPATSQGYTKPSALTTSVKAQEYFASSGPPGLVRTKSLKYMNNDKPPTPPEKEILKIPRRPRTTSDLRPAAAMPPPAQQFDRNSDYLRTSSNMQYGEYESRNNVNIVHQGSYSSMCGIIEEGTVNVNSPRHEMLRAKKEQSAQLQNSAAATLTSVFEPFDSDYDITPVPARRQWGRSERNQHSANHQGSEHVSPKTTARTRKSNAPRRFVASSIYPDSDDDLWIEPAAIQARPEILQPGFYTPSDGSLASEFKQFDIRPSHNNDRNLYLVRHPRYPVSHPMASEAYAVNIPEPSPESHQTSSGNPSTGPGTGESTTLQGSGELEQVLSSSFGTSKSRELPDMIIPSASEASFNMQFPSAAPTPLYQRGPSGQNTDNSVRHSGGVLDILQREFTTRAGAVNVRVPARDTSNDDADKTIGELSRLHHENISHLNKNFGDLRRRLDSIDGHVSELGSSISDVKSQGEESSKDIKSVHSSVTIVEKRLSDDLGGMRTSVDKLTGDIERLIHISDSAIQQSRGMNRNVHALNMRIRQLEKSQGQVREFLKARHTSFPETPALPESLIHPLMRASSPEPEHFLSQTSDSALSSGGDLIYDGLYRSRSRLPREPSPPPHREKPNTRERRFSDHTRLHEKFSNVYGEPLEAENPFADENASSRPSFDSHASTHPKTSEEYPRRKESRQPSRQPSHATSRATYREAAFRAVSGSSVGVDEYGRPVPKLNLPMSRPGIKTVMGIPAGNSNAEGNKTLASPVVPSPALVSPSKIPRLRSPRSSAGVRSDGDENLGKGRRG
ncbi:hypothetical protein BT63DRAFT_420414 [Microthyrium microscopicum]|uniref:Uncharacterized protein n=1 Tax=Microthyrium microscopicum TaxID=703497 RepID=A0A6A6UTP7_9PEZI|nr:hypothetical protein BT63DRAFT_420414 [Microthyrium microscopicum]